MAYVKYESLDRVTESNLKDNYPLTESKYKWAKEILDESVYKKEHFDQFYIVACLLSKSFILKLKKSDIKTKFKKLLEYSLYELNIYSEFELYLMYKFLSDDSSTQRTFSKIQNISKNVLDNIKNTVWDILHVRLIETQMINDLKNEQIIFHYIGTKDVGLQNIININPLKIIGFLDEYSVVVRENNVNELFLDSEINDMLQNHVNKDNIGNINYKEKFKEISYEITKIVNKHL